MDDPPEKSTSHGDGTHISLENESDAAEMMRMALTV